MRKALTTLTIGILAIAVAVMAVAGISAPQDRARPSRCATAARSRSRRPPLSSREEHHRDRFGASAAGAHRQRHAAVPAVDDQDVDQRQVDDPRHPVATRSSGRRPRRRASTRSACVSRTPARPIPRRRARSPSSRARPGPRPARTTTGGRAGGATEEVAPPALPRFAPPTPPLAGAAVRAASLRGLRAAHVNARTWPVCPVGPTRPGRCADTLAIVHLGCAP